jgi:hypothetical protein
MRYGHAIEWRTYWFRVLFLTLMACLNSVLALVEEVGCDECPSFLPFDPM